MAGKKSSRTFASGAPDFSVIKKDHPSFRRNFWNAFSYAHYELANTVLKKETLKYLKLAKSPLYERADNLHENMYISVGKFCYIANHGGDLPDNIPENLEKSIVEMIVNYEKERENNKIKRRSETFIEKESAPEGPSIQDRLKAKALEVASEIDGWVDEFMLNKKATKDVTDFLGLFTKYELKSGHIKYLLACFEDERQEISEAYITKDPYIKESFSGYTRPQLKNFNQFYQNLFIAGETLCKTATTTRTPKIKKPTDINKLVSKLKYLKEDNVYNISSLNPVHIPGAQEVWVFNIRTKKLGCYKAYDASGLSVKGASIVNISSESIEKTLRKPVEILTEFSKTSKVKLRTFLKNITTIDIPLKGKLNENTLILRIEK